MVAESSSQFNIHDAKTNLSRIIERVEHGEEIVISRAGTPVAKVVPLTRRVHRTARGSLRGLLVMAPDWDSPEVNDSIADDFGITTTSG
jgi:prevent-host-death family protein